MLGQVVVMHGNVTQETLIVASDIQGGVTEKGTPMDASTAGSTRTCYRRAHYSHFRSEVKASNSITNPVKIRRTVRDHQTNRAKGTCNRRPQQSISLCNVQVRH